MITNSLFIKKSLFINNDFNKSSKKKKQNIVVVGNGIAGTTFIKHMNNPKYDITVVSPNPLCTYTPLIPYKSIKNNDIVISKDVRDIKKDISYIQSSISDIDLQTKELISEDSTRIKYDYVVFAHGTVNNTFNIKGIDDYCYFVSNNNIDDIYNKLNSLDDNSNISIIGSGLTGIEMVGYLMDLKKFNITIIDGLSTNHLMNNVNNCDYLVKHWENNNINTKFNNFVQSVTDKSIILKNDTIDYDMTIWCGGYKQTNLTAKLTDLLIGKFDIKSKRGLYISSFMEVYGNKYLFGIPLISLGTSIFKYGNVKKSQSFIVSLLIILTICLVYFNGILSPLPNHPVFNNQILHLCSVIFFNNNFPYISGCHIINGSAKQVLYVFVGLSIFFSVPGILQVYPSKK